MARSVQAGPYPGAQHNLSPVVLEYGGHGGDAAMHVEIGRDILTSSQTRTSPHRIIARNFANSSPIAPLYGNKG